LISVVCLWLIAVKIDLDETLSAFSAFAWPYLAAGIVSLAVGYLLRVERWATLLRGTGAALTGRDCRPAFLASIALNNLLPFRAGDIVRAVIFPSAMGVQRITSTASLLLERLIDLLTLLTLLALGLLVVDIKSLPDWVGGTAVLLALASVAALALVVFFGVPLAGLFERLARHPASWNRGIVGATLSVVARLFKDVLAMSRPSVLIAIAGLSILLWCAEAGLFYFVLQGCSLDVTMAGAVLAMAIATLATLVPSSPGYVGPFHLAAFTAAEMLGANASQAAVFSIVSHLALWLPTTLAGVVALLANPQLLRRSEVKDVGVASQDGSEVERQ
jgi:uncharacterized protein (TIRG00374 family)